MAKKAKKTTHGIEQKQEPITGNRTTPIIQKQFPLSNFRVQALILAILGFVFYCNTFQHEAAFDDMMAITDNAYVQRGVAGIPDILTKDAFQSYLESKQGGNQLAGGRYRPLSLITFAIEQQIMGTAPDNETTNDKEIRVAQEMHARHVVNVLLYILSVIVLLYFLRRIVFPNQPAVAFLAALLFTIHPIHTEVVANVKSRDEILSVLFISLTFIKAFSYWDSKKKNDLILALLCFFLALLSKEYAVMLLVLLPLGFYLFRKESIGSSSKITLPYLIPFGIYIMLRLSAITAMPQGAENNIMNNPYLYATGVQKIATEIMVLLDYLKLLFFPSPLSSVYTYNSIPYTGFSDPLVWLSIIVHLGLLAAMFILVARRQVLGFAIAFYLINLVLVSNIFFDIGALMGERLIYHSSISFCIAAAYLIYTGFEKIKQPAIAKPGLTLLMILLVVISGYKTINRNIDWKNDNTLFMKDVHTAPNSILANNNAAAACMIFAKKATDVTQRKEWFEKAIAYFDKAISLYPMYMNARLNRGLSYYDMGLPDMAIPDWDTVRKYTPSEKKLPYYFSVLGRYYYNQGMKYGNAGKIDSAVIAFKKGTEAAPNVADIWYQLANAYKAQGKEAEFKAAYDMAEKLKANSHNN